MNNYPDIGPDPLKLDGEARQFRGSIEKVRMVLGDACAVQQKGVPDQTALVWRIDLSRLLDDHTVMQARWKYLQPALEKRDAEIDRLREYILGVHGHVMALAHEESVENLLEYVETQGKDILQSPPK